MKIRINIKILYVKWEKKIPKLENNNFAAVLS